MIFFSFFAHSGELFPDIVDFETNVTIGAFSF